MDKRTFRVVSLGCGVAMIIIGIVAYPRLARLFGPSTPTPPPVFAGIVTYAKGSGFEVGHRHYLWWGESYAYIWTKISANGTKDLVNHVAACGYDQR